MRLMQKNSNLQYYVELIEELNNIPTNGGGGDDPTQPLYLKE